MQIILVNFRKEILPFISKTTMNSNADTTDDCSDVLIVSDSMAVAAHNEDANVSLVGHTYAFCFMNTVQILGKSAICTINQYPVTCIRVYDGFAAI